MRNKILLLTAFGGLLIGSCKKSDYVPPQPSEKVILNTNADELSQRISVAGAGVLSISKVDKSGGKDPNDSTAYKYPLELIANVTPPSYEGQAMRATHVDINGDFAYVSYNLEGEKYLGGIDVFNVSNAASPKLVAEAIFPSTDISAVVYNNNRLYVAGAADVDKDPALKSPAVLGYVDLNNGIPGSDFKFYDIDGMVGTDLAVDNGKIYVTSGATGSLSVYNTSDFSKVKSIDINDLRSVAINNGKLAVLSGTEGVDVYDVNSYSQLNAFSFGKEAADAKRTMDFNGDKLLIAGGKKGILYYNITSGSQLTDISLPTEITDVDPSDIVTNAVSNNDGLMLAANGAAGLYVCDEETADQLNLVGAIDIDGSANYVKSKGDYIFVATGKGGLQILKLTRPDATFSSCDSYPAYDGSAYLNVNSGQDLKYRGSAALLYLNVNANLTFCGSMSVLSGLNINSGGNFNFNGALSFGKNPSNTLYINSNATLYIQGNLTIYGNLTLNGGTLRIGDGSTVTIYGKVTKNSGAVIEGSNYTDTFNKLK